MAAVEYKLKCGSIMLVDKEFLPICHLAFLDKGYVRLRIKTDKSTIPFGFHRAVLNVDSQFEVDHIDRNRLNNTRANLRIVNRTQSSMNRGPHKKKELKHPYKGINLIKRSGLKNPWQANIKVNYKSIFLGYHQTALEAALAYDRAVTLYHGEFGVKNFTDHHYNLGRSLMRSINNSL